MPLFTFNFDLWCFYVLKGLFLITEVNSDTCKETFVTVVLVFTCCWIKCGNINIFLIHKEFWINFVNNYNSLEKNNAIRTGNNQRLKKNGSKLLSM